MAIKHLVAHQPDTVRGNMYLVVSAGWLPDTGKNVLQPHPAAIEPAAENYTVPFSRVVDTVHATIKPSSWSGLQDFADTVKQAYRKDYWANLPEYVEIIVEKDTVAGRVASVTREYDVPLHPIRGYSSTSYAWSIAQGWADIKKPITIYYIGDHDPSGRDLERNIHDKLARYSKRDFELGAPWSQPGTLRRVQHHPAKAQNQGQAVSPLRARVGRQVRRGRGDSRNRVERYDPAGNREPHPQGIMGAAKTDGRSGARIVDEGNGAARQGGRKRRVARRLLAAEQYQIDRLSSE